MSKTLKKIVAINLAILLVAQATFNFWALNLVLVGMLLVFYYGSKTSKSVPQYLTFIGVFIALGCIYLDQESFLGVNAGVGVLLIFLFAKVLESKKTRDWIVVFNFAIFVAVSSLLFSQTLWMCGLVLIAFVTSLLGFYYLQQQSFLGSDIAYSASKGLKNVVYLMMYTLPIFLVLFFLFPRFAPLWHFPLPQEQATTGLSEQMSPGDIAHLSESGALAFRVVTDISKLPKQSELYWRAMALDQYDGRMWRRSTHDQTFFPSAIPYPKSFRYQYLTADPKVKWIAILEKSIPIQRDYQLQKDGSLMMKPNRSTHPIYLQWIGNKDTHFLNDSSLITRNMVYPIEMDLESQTLAKTLYQHSLNRPELYVQEVLSWYKKQKFEYTLSPGKSAHHAIDDFLFNKKQGFCEHYASSFVMLMRYVGIPARVVIGYQGGKAAHDGKSWEVRQLDAHAWSEVWLNHQWQRIDPTAIIAPERIDLGMQNLLAQGRSVWNKKSALQQQKLQWLTRVHRWSDFITYQWQRKVVGYDEGQQLRWLKYVGLENSRQLVGLLVIALCFCVGMYFSILFFKNRYLYNHYQRTLMRFNAHLELCYQQKYDETHTAWLCRLSHKVEKDERVFLLALAEYERYARYSRQHTVKLPKKYVEKLKKCALVLRGK